MKYLLYKALLLFPTLCLIPGVGFTQVFRHFSDKDGAPITSVMSIAQDKEGFIWLGTSRGLYRYDSRTFKKYKHDPNDPRSIAADYIQRIYVDSKGRLWVGAEHNGLSLYNRETDSFKTFRHDPKNPNSIVKYYGVEGFAEDSEKNLWVANAFGLNKIIVAGDSVKITRVLENFPHRIECIVADPKGGLWLGTVRGLFKFKNGKTTLVGRHIANNKADSYGIRSINLDAKGTLWLGTNQGLIKLDTVTKVYQSVESVQRNGIKPTIFGITADSNQKLWLASESGLANFDQQSGKTIWHVRDKTNPNALIEDFLLTTFIDQRKGLWIGSYYQGVSYLNTSLPDFSLWPYPSTNSLAPLFRASKMGKTRTGKIWAISDQHEYIFINGAGSNEHRSVKLKLPVGVSYDSFFLDNSDILWCGGNDYALTSYDLNTGRIKKYSLSGIDKAPPVGATRIQMINEDSKGRIWISGSMLGLTLFERKTGEFKRTHSAVIESVMEDSGGNIWFVGARDIHILKRGSTKVQILKVSRSLVKERTLTVSRIAKDASGRIWATSDEGLFLYNYRTGQFLPHIGDAPDILNFVQDLQIDARGYLWLSSESRLICYHPDKKIIKLYDYRDGLPFGGVLTSSSSLKDDKGYLYFSASEGIFKFNPDKKADNETAARLVLTSLKLFNKQVNAQDETGLLNNAIESTKEIVFEHDQNIFTLDFALLSYGRSDMNQYAYRLSNFEKNWNYVQVPSATYTNLPPGTYTFLAKAANGDGHWNPQLLELKITILPPWWKTWYAYLTYFLLLAAAVYVITRFFWIRTSFRKESSLNQVKLDFFTNVSHEIRTHLSLISGPLEKAHQQLNDGKSVAKNLNYARTNSDRLLLLVNELLDFRKIQASGSRLLVQEHDVVKILKSVIASFEHIASEKEIETTFLSPDTPCLLWFDIAQMQKVFYNLLSNAYKFTPEGGKVIVRVIETSIEVTITVEDNGKGVAAEHLEKLFTYFYQAESDKPGYGIGLALSKSIVEQHRGYLTAESRLANAQSSGATTLIVRMLKGKRHFSEDQIASQNTDYTRSLPFETDVVALADSVENQTRNNTILLIEDNDQLRVFIRELFETDFNILEAENGLRGLELARENMPDIILSDVMMPEMNGVEVCRHLKNDLVTSHIPVVLLTARTENGQIIEGLKSGADDYLTKPFDPRILELKISNLIRMREQMKERYRQSILTDQITENTETSIAGEMNEVFVAKLRALVLARISDVNFGVNELAVGIGMSVSVLYRKLRSMTGMTVNEFVKSVRLNEGKKLLESGIYQVNEVATIIGFEDSKYFSKEFRKVFGKTPTEMRKQIPG